MSDVSNVIYSNYLGYPAGDPRWRRCVHLGRGPAPGHHVRLLLHLLPRQVTNHSAASGHVTTVRTSYWPGRGAGACPGRGRGGGCWAGWGGAPSGGRTTSTTARRRASATTPSWQSSGHPSEAPSSVIIEVVMFSTAFLSLCMIRIFKV